MVVILVGPFCGDGLCGGGGFALEMDTFWFLFQTSEYISNVINIYGTIPVQNQFEWYLS